MPWKEVTAVSERMEFVARLKAGERMSDLCREFGISRKTGYKFAHCFLLTAKRENAFRQKGNRQPKCSVVNVPIAELFCLNSRSPLEHFGKAIQHLLHPGPIQGHRHFDTRSGPPHLRQDAARTPSGSRKTALMKPACGPNPSCLAISTVSCTAACKCSWLPLSAST